MFSFKWDFDEGDWRVGFKFSRMPVDVDGDTQYDLLIQAGPFVAKFTLIK